MGVNTDLQNEPQSILDNSEGLGEAAILLIALGSVLIILCAASIIYGLGRRRQNSDTNAGVASKTEECTNNPTDFMKSLATWDRCHSIDEILEKRRRSIWTLEIFENYGVGSNKTDIKSPTGS